MEATAALAARDKVNKFLVAARDGDVNHFQETVRAFDEGEGIAKAVLDIKDANGRGALHFAAQSGNDAVCQYLLENLSIPVDPRDDDGETPLIHAARGGHFETSLCLLEHGADPGASSKELDATALHHAAGIGSTQIIKLLLERGVKVDVPSDAGTPLIWAAGHEKIDAVKILLEHGANPNATTDDDVTALLTAAATGSCNIVDLLIKKGAEVNVVAGGGATPLHIAADGGNRKMVTSLLEAGANPNAVDEDDTKPILAAALKGYREIVDILLSVTSPIPRVKEWSTDGVLHYAEQLAAEEEKSNGHKAREAQAMTESELRLPEVSPERKEKSLQAKARGDEAFKKKNFMLAMDAYTQALDLDPCNSTVLANRSLCWMRMGQPEHALADARLVRKIRPNWSKGCYREGSALRLLQKFEEAANAFYEGVMLDPDNKELVDAFREAVEAGRAFHGTAAAKDGES